MELSEKAPEAAEHRREGEAKAEPVKYQDYVTDEEEVVKKALVYILQGSASRRVRKKIRLRRKMKDC